MTTFNQTLSKLVTSDEVLSDGDKAYFRRRLQNRFHRLILGEFLKLRALGEINNSVLARRIGQDPGRVTKLLSAPGNWTLKTISDLLLAMGAEPSLGVSYINEQPIRNMAHQPWVMQTDETTAPIQTLMIGKEETSHGRERADQTNYR